MKRTGSTWPTGDNNKSWVTTLPKKFARDAGLEVGDFLEFSWREGSDSLLIRVRKASDQSDRLYANMVVEA